MDNYGNKAAGVAAKYTQGLQGLQGMQEGTAAPPPAPLTLVGAISGLDDLNKRLRGLCQGTHEIAQAIGGPYPIGCGQIKGAEAPSSAMARLNDGIGDAHGAVAELEQAMSAIRRSLGG